MSSQLIISLLVAAFFFPQTTQAHDICKTPSCTACTRTCPNIPTTRAQLTDCDNKLRIARSKYLTDATLDCMMDPCAGVFMGNACNLLPKSNTPNNYGGAIKSGEDFDALMAALEGAEKSARFATDDFNKRATEISSSLDSDRKVYYDRTTKLLIDIQIMFADALKTRAHYYRQKEYLDSLTYRRTQNEVTRLKFESKDLRSQLNYWSSWNESLALAVQTSPLTLRRARDALRTDLESFSADAALIDSLRKLSLTKEEQAAFIIDLKERVMVQLLELRTHNAHMRAEMIFIQETRQEIFKLFATMLSKLRANQVQVACGALAVSDIVTEAIMDSA